MVWEGWMRFHSWWVAGRCHCMLLRVISPFPPLSGNICQMLLAQGQKCSLPSHCIGPGSQYWLWDLGLVYFEVYLLCISWAWRITPCSHQLVSSIIYPQVSGMVLVWPLPHLSLVFSCSYVEFKFCACRNSHSLVKTKVFINCLLSSL